MTRPIYPALYLLVAGCSQSGDSVATDASVVDTDSGPVVLSVSTIELTDVQNLQVSSCSSGDAPGFSFYFQVEREGGWQGIIRTIDLLPTEVVVSELSEAIETSGRVQTYSRRLCGTGPEPRALRLRTVPSTTPTVSVSRLEEVLAVEMSCRPDVSAGKELSIFEGGTRIAVLSFGCSSSCGRGQPALHVIDVPSAEVAAVHCIGRPSNSNCTSSLHPTAYGVVQRCSVSSTVGIEQILDYLTFDGPTDETRTTMTSTALSSFVSFAHAGIFKEASDRFAIRRPAQGPELPLWLDQKLLRVGQIQPLGEPEAALPVRREDGTEGYYVFDVTHHRDSQWHKTEALGEVVVKAHGHIYELIRSPCASGDGICFDVRSLKP